MRFVLLIALLSVACAPTPKGDVAVAEPALDSLVLERSPCFGMCPMYRLRIDGRGHVYYQSRSPNDKTVASDSISIASVAWLMAEAKRVRLYDMPERIQDSPELCKMMATDHPSASIAIFAPDSVKRVDHYLGCYGPGPDPNRVPALVELERFYAAIDSVAGTARWTRRPGSKSEQ
jgi:hypothetical protein